MAWSIPWRKTAEKVLESAGHEVPTLYETMNETVDGANNNLWNIISGGIQKVLPSAISTAQAALGQLSYSGSTGNFTSAEDNISIVAKFQPIVGTNPARIGSPLYQTKTINTLSGFVACENAVFSSTIATGTEERAVEAFLNSGFYYE